MSEILYSPEIYLPDWFTMPTDRVNLKYSKHALYACNNDRYGAIPVFKTLPLCRFRLVELGVVDGPANELGVRSKIVSKIVVRGRYDSERDIIFVLIPGTKHYFVKTVWYNLTTDTHKTLKRERYAVA